MKKGLLIIIFSLLTVSSSFAARPKQLVGVYKNSIGAKYSTISGYGLNVSRTLFNHFTVELNSFFIYNQFTRWENSQKIKITRETKDITYDFGVEFQYDIITTSTTRVYALVGGYYSSVEKEDFDIKNVDSEFGSNSNSQENKMAGGLGFGFQFFMESHVAGNASFGYKFEKSDVVENDSPSTNKTTNLGFGFGISYYF